MFSFTPNYLKCSKNKTKKKSIWLIYGHSKRRRRPEPDVAEPDVAVPGGRTPDAGRRSPTSRPDPIQHRHKLEIRSRANVVDDHRPWRRSRLRPRFIALVIYFSRPSPSSRSACVMSSERWHVRGFGAGNRREITVYF